MTMTVTNNDLGGIVLFDPDYRDELLTCAGAGTVVAGTILARDSVSGNLVPFVKGGVANENGIPKCMTTVDVVTAGAGNVPLRALVGGKVRKDKLIINADGNGTNVDNAVIDQLRDFGILAEDSQDLSMLDNQ